MRQLKRGVSRGELYKSEPRCCGAWRVRVIDFPMFRRSGSRVTEIYVESLMIKMITNNVQKSSLDFIKKFETQLSPKKKN